MIRNIYIAALMVVSVLLTGCDPEEPRGPEEVKQMTLIYAINNNNLSADLVANESQMLEAMGNVDPDVYKLLVYKYTDDGPGLYEVSNDKGRRTFFLIRRYDKSELSIDPKRVSDVLSDALEEYPGVESNLFFWGHGNGWVNPNKYSNTVVSNLVKADGNGVQLSVEMPELYGFGGEYVDETKRKTDYVDLDLLAGAIPEGMFDMIWFDCCYMSSIEVAYQFRNKCNTFVAYPTEIMAEGLPYNLVIPKIVGIAPDRRAAAKALYDYYTGKASPDPVTVAVMDMGKIEDVAAAAGEIFGLGSARPSVTNMQNYSRFYSTPYYDFSQYLREYAEANVSVAGEEKVEALVKALNDALSEFVVYSAASDEDFNYPYAKPILKENFSGISIHPYMGVNSAREDFYRKLDWYTATWGKLQ